MKHIGKLDQVAKRCILLPTALLRVCLQFKLFSKLFFSCITCLCLRLCQTSCWKGGRIREHFIEDHVLCVCLQCKLFSEVFFVVLLVFVFCLCQTSCWEGGHWGRIMDQFIEDRVLCVYLQIIVGMHSTILLHDVKLSPYWHISHFSTENVTFC